MVELSGGLILAIILFLIFLSGFFSGSETGLTGASRARIHKLKMEGNKRAVTVSNLRRKKEHLIGAILLGNNAVNIAASSLATVLAIRYLGEEGVIYATIVMTIVVLIFAEVLPKTYAINNAEKVALMVAPFFKVIIKILGPITATVQAVVTLFLRMLRLTGGEDTMSGNEVLRGTIDLHHREGLMIKGDRDMLDSILDLDDTEVGEVMIHRKHMETIDIDIGAASIIDHVLGSGHSRIPLWESEPENIIGVLHVKDLLHAIRNHTGDLEDLNFRKICREPWFIPETTTLREQLQAFREKRNHFSLVVDEYGSLLGLVTLEDILEEIVGQIDDEHDVSQRKIRKQSDGSYIVDGTVTVRDVNRELDWNLPEDTATTVAGLLIHEAQRIPDAGQNFRFHGYRFEVLKKHRNQVTSLRIKRAKKRVRAKE